MTIAFLVEGRKVQKELVKDPHLLKSDAGRKKLHGLQILVFFLTSQDITNINVMSSSGLLFSFAMIVLFSIFRAFVRKIKLKMFIFLRFFLIIMLFVRALM
jgi:hypothetical protein